MLTIYYDASCPLCATEMNALQCIDRGAHLRLVDCSPAGFEDADVAAAGIAHADLMACIHARDGRGRWLRGVDVFEQAYSLAGLENIARVWAHPRLRPLWDRAYPWVARHRMLLSRLQLNKVFGWWIAQAARKAERRAQSCSVRWAHDSTSPVCEARVVRTAQATASSDGGGRTET